MFAAQNNAPSPWWREGYENDRRRADSLCGRRGVWRWPRNGLPSGPREPVLGALRHWAGSYRRKGSNRRSWRVVGFFPDDPGAVRRGARDLALWCPRLLDGGETLGGHVVDRDIRWRHASLVRPAHCFHAHHLIAELPRRVCQARVEHATSASAILATAVRPTAQGGHACGSSPALADSPVCG